MFWFFSLRIFSRIDFEYCKSSIGKLFSRFYTVYAILVDPEIIQKEEGTKIYSILNLVLFNRVRSISNFRYHRRFLQTDIESIFYRSSIIILIRIDLTQ